MTPTIAIITVALYFAVLVTLSRVSGRKATNATFFTGNRRTPWPIVAFAMTGAVISGVTFISVPGMVVTKGYSYLQMCAGFIVGYVVIAYVLLPLFYRKNLISIYSYLGERFGPTTYKSGAMMFFISEILGASVRFFVVCAVVQAVVCRPLGIPFAVNVLATVSLIWFYTAAGGVKTLIWTDLLKSACLILSVALCIYFIARNMSIGLSELPGVIVTDPTSKVFYFSDPKSPLYFWKQFTAGVFMVIVMNGLNQDMMQRHMSCSNASASRKNMIVSSVVQFVVIAMFLMLGTMLMAYASARSIGIPSNTDELFGMIATDRSLPLVVGVLFLVGLVSAAYSAAGSALTSLTTSFTLDILNGQQRSGGNEYRLARLRRRVHLMMALLMAITILAFEQINTGDTISAVFTLASLTYGPILGLYAYGMLTTRPVADRLVPWICIFSPIASLGLQWWIASATGYHIGFELLLINGLITFTALAVTQTVNVYVKKLA